MYSNKNQSFILQNLPPQCKKLKFKTLLQKLIENMNHYKKLILI